MPSEERQDKTERRYECTKCDSIVRARWFGSGSFAVGCDCITVPVVPQMGQGETPGEWRVEREACCRDAERSDLEYVYGEPAEYQCPECGAEYDWRGAMVEPPETDEGEDRPDDESTLMADGGRDRVEHRVSHEVVDRPSQYQWVTDDGTRWILTDIPTSPCHECGADIPESHHCYFRDGPAADDGFDHVCWDCGDEVTGFSG